MDSGSNFLNSGEFYGQPDPTLGLKLLARFFAAEPSYADKVFLSVKGGSRPDFSPDGSLEGLRKSVLHINEVLGSHGATKHMDLFEPARLDKSVGIEQVMKNLLVLRDEGHFTHIGLSEVSAETLRTASKVGPVAAVEFEYSLWALDAETNGLLSATAELGITAIAYSPLGRGFLTGSIKKRSDIPSGDLRLLLDRFSAENFDQNLRLVEDLTRFAEGKGVTPAQLALAWILAQADNVMPIPGSTRIEGVKESLEALEVKLSAEELKQVRRILDSHTIVGGRYNDHLQGSLNA